MAVGRKKGLPESPDLKLLAVWEAFNKKPSDKSHEYHLTVYNNLKHFDESNRVGILDELLKIENDSLGQNNRLRHIRQKVMDLVDRKTATRHLLMKSGTATEAADRPITPDKDLDLTLADCEIQIAILRAYIWGKYSDGQSNDWFDCYCYLSGLYHGNNISSQSGNNARPFMFEGTSLDLNAENFLTCRQKCLDAYIGQEFNLPANTSNWFIKLLRTVKKQPIWRRLVS